MYAAVTGQNYEQNAAAPQAVTDYNTAPMNFAGPTMDQSELMGAGSQQLQYIQDTIQSHQLHQELAHRQQQINAAGVFEGVNNFNSNDTNIL